MKRSIQRKFYLIVALWPLLAVTEAWTMSPGADAPEELDRLRKKTVMITVTFDDQTVEQGSGVILCQKDQRAYVLTARHVLSGKASTGEKPSRERTEIQFFRDIPPPVVDDLIAGKRVLDVHEVPQEDLALLSFPLSEDLKSSAYFGPPFGMLLVGEDDRPEVVAVGFRSKPSMESWAVEPGELLAGDGKVLQHSAQVTEGFSGGPLFSMDGALVGISQRRVVSGDALEPSWYGEAYSVEHLLPVIGRWLPEGCLRAEPRTATILGGLVELKGILPEILTRHATEMNVRIKPLELNPKFRFGPYQVISQRKGKLSLDLDDGRSWNAQCKKGKIKEGGFLARVAAKALDKALGVDTSPVKPYKLTCAFGEESGEGAARLQMRIQGTVAGGGSGSVKAGAVDVDVMSWAGGQAVYLFYVEDHILGAVSTYGEETVWLLPSVSGETRSAVLLASSALLWKHISGL